MVCRSSVRLLEAAANTVKKIQQERPARLPPLPTARDLLRIYKISALRNLSQNFLLDYRLTNKIVTFSGSVKDCYVCEVGPGPGNITRNIVENGAKLVTVIEKDRRFLPSLQLLADACQGRLKIVMGDVMDINMETFFPEEYAQDWKMPCPPFYIIGNLPFNISTPLIIRWLRHCSKHTGPFKHGRTKLTLTFQKEVGYRMVAKPRSDYRCRLSIMCQYLCNVDNLFIIPGKAFFPKPEVDVAVVQFTPRIKPEINQPFNIVERIMRTLFHHRQKHCIYGIKLLFPKNHEHLAHELITKTRINSQKRAIDLEMEELSDICDTFVDLCDGNEDLLHFDFRAPTKIKSSTYKGSGNESDEIYDDYSN